MNLTETKQPFFARFLETQHKQEQDATRQLNDPLSVPGPTNPFKDSPFTEKWPSDMEDE